MSLLLDMHALRLLGAAREAAYFATAPFIGALLAIPLLAERPGLAEAAAGLVMVAGVVLLARERHSHLHTHEPVEHEHLHVHDEHHQHDHDHDHDHPAQGTSPHSHRHRHEPITHEHPHLPDLHHRHSTRQWPGEQDGTYRHSPDPAGARSNEWNQVLANRGQLAPASSPRRRKPR